MRSFSDFQNSFNFDKLNYDLNSLAVEELKKENELFTQDQYAFLTKTIAVMSLALLRQYHEWLNETHPT